MFEVVLDIYQKIISIYLKEHTQLKSLIEFKLDNYVSKTSIIIKRKYKNKIVFEFLLLKSL